jgi:hypothetical protein
LRPNSIEGVIRFVRDDKAVRSLREELGNLVAEGGRVSEKWFAEYMNRLFKSELVRQGRVRKIRLLGSAVGTLLPGAALAQEIAQGAAVEAGGGLVERALGRGRERYHWYYALQRL